jgi:hypothetical protein
VEDLLKEISEVRKKVHREYQWLQGLGLGDNLTKGVSAVEEETVVLAKRKRLLYLFVEDLSSGICGEVLTEKSQRDSLVSSKVWSRRDGVSLESKIAGWIFIVLTNLGLLFYLYLFAINQTHSRQAAWFKSFLIWLIFEVVISSTGLVVLTHLLVPLLLLADVAKLKEKVLMNLITFRETYLNAQRDIEEGVCPQPERDGEVSFNAAKFLFSSWRVASLFNRLPESGLILQFRTPWPKKKFGRKRAEVTSEYEQAVILTALSRIALYFFSSLLRFHTLLQDIFVQTVCNSGFGLLCLWLIRLYGINPSLPVAVVAVLFIGVAFLLRRASQNNQMRAKLASVLPQEPQSLATNPPSMPLQTANDIALNTNGISPVFPQLLNPTEPPSDSGGRQDQSEDSELEALEDSEFVGDSSDHSDSFQSDSSVNWSDLSSDLDDVSSDDSGRSGVVPQDITQEEEM